MDFDNTEVTFSISNMLGESVVKQKIIGYRNEQNLVVVDVSDFPNGVYVVNIFERKRKIYKKIVVQRN